MILLSGVSYRKLPETVVSNEMIFVHLPSNPLVLQKCAQGEYACLGHKQEILDRINLFARYSTNFDEALISLMNISPMNRLNQISRETRLVSSAHTSRICERNLMPVDLEEQDASRVWTARKVKKSASWNNNFVSYYRCSHSLCTLHCVVLSIGLCYNLLLPLLPAEVSMSLFYEYNIRVIKLGTSRWLIKSLLSNTLARNYHFPRDR